MIILSILEDVRSCLGDHQGLHMLARIGRVITAIAQVHHDILNGRGVCW